MKADVYVYGFYEKINTGDYNNTLAVYNGLQSNDLAKAGLLELADLARITKEAAGKDEHILIVTSEAGAKAVNALEKIPENVRIFWTGHQTSKALNEAVVTKKISSVFIANSGISKFNTELYRKNCDLVKLPGVPVDVNRESAIIAYENKKDSFLAVAEQQKRVIVFFGGDAPDTEGKFNCITREDGIKIGQNLANIALKNNAVIEIVNGPRTGQRNPDTKEETLAHYQYHPKTNELLVFEEDETSKGIRKGLESAGLKDGKDFQIHHFKWGMNKQKNVSMYEPVLGLALQDKTAIVIYTGESITEGNKLARYFTGRQNYALQVSSMHEGHQAFCDDLFTRGYVGIINAEGKLQEPEIRNERPLDVTARLIKEMQQQISPKEKSAQLQYI